MNTNTTNTTTTTQEAQNALLITALYEVAFNRLPDAEGLAWWMNDMNNGVSFHNVARQFAVHIPQFGYETTEAIVNKFSMNAFEHTASQDVINHWGVLAVNAVPSFYLAEQMALQLVGMKTDVAVV